MTQITINETSTIWKNANSDFHVLNLIHFLKFSLYIRSISPLILVTLYCMQPARCLCRNWCLNQCNNWENDTIQISKTRFFGYGGQTILTRSLVWCVTPIRNVRPAFFFFSFINWFTGKFWNFISWVCVCVWVGVGRVRNENKKIKKSISRSNKSNFSPKIHVKLIYFTPKMRG